MNERFDPRMLTEDEREDLMVDLRFATPGKVRHEVEEREVKSILKRPISGHG